MVYSNVDYISFMETKVTSPNKKQTERIAIILKNCFCDGSWNFNNLFISFDNNSVECHKIELVLVTTCLQSIRYSHIPIFYSE